MAAGIAVALALHLKVMLLLHLCCIHQHERGAGNVHLQGGESLLSFYGFLQFFCCYFCFCCFLFFSTACSFYYDYRDTRALHRIVAYLSAAASPSLASPLPAPTLFPLRSLLCCLCVWSASGVANLCCCCNCLLFNCTPHAASCLLHVAYI